MASEEDKGTDEKQVVVPRNAADVQRLKLEKLMKKVDKQVVVPERPQEKEPGVFRPPEFIRHIWGSSAGAGSGDFHVYRGIRRREYARQKLSKEKSEKEELDEAFKRKIEENKIEAEERTAKKRAKRQKKKMKQKANKMQKMKEETNKEKSDSDEEEENEEEENEEKKET